MAIHTVIINHVLYSISTTSAKLECAMETLSDLEYDTIVITTWWFLVTKCVLITSRSCHNVHTPSYSYITLCISLTALFVPQWHLDLYSQLWWFYSLPTSVFSKITASLKIKCIKPCISDLLATFYPRTCARSKAISLSIVCRLIITKITRLPHLGI